MYSDKAAGMTKGIRRNSGKTAFFWGAGTAGTAKPNRNLGLCAWICVKSPILRTNKWHPFGSCCSIPKRKTLRRLAKVSGGPEAYCW